MNVKTNGWVNGFIGMTIFAGSLPATRAAVVDLAPVFLTCARATIAALLGLILLVIFRARRPVMQDLPSLIITAMGVVVGFPLLTSLALQHVSSAHSIVLWVAPGLYRHLRGIAGGERPRPAFWFFSLLGSAVVAGYALSRGAKGSLNGDVCMLAAVVVCGLGYAEGARLSRRLGGWQVICWALLVSLPVMLPVSMLTLPASFAQVNFSAWLGFGYVSLFSMLIGFIFWYRGLAQGGIAAVGQLQLFQPFIGLGLASLLLHETVSWSMLIVTLAAIVCVAGAKRFAV